MPTTNNDDVAGVYSRFNRFVEELVKSQSANVTALKPFDQTRFLAYLAELEALIAWVQSRPLLDLPETSPLERTLPDPVPVPELENPMVRDLVHLFERGRDELVNSQSSRQSSGLIRFDEQRVLDVISKAKSYITEYASVVTPVDLPESSPRASSTGPGRTGISTG